MGTSTYSFWHFLPEKVPIEYVIEKAYEMDLDGVEISPRHRCLADYEFMTL